MPYIIEGVVAAVPKTNKAVYIKHATEAADYFKKLGATRLVECLSDDVPKGVVTDFSKATQAKDDEVPVFPRSSIPTRLREMQRTKRWPRTTRRTWTWRSTASAYSGAVRAGHERVGADRSRPQRG